MNGMKFMIGIILGIIFPGISQAVGGEKSEPFRVGAIFSITGRASGYGEIQRNTAKMVEEIVNEAGGIQGRPLEVFIEDNKSNFPQTLLCSKKLLIKDNVLAIVGTTASVDSMVIVPYMEESKTPFISCASYHGIVTPKEELVRIYGNRDKEPIRIGDRIIYPAKEEDLDRILPLKALERPRLQNKWIFKTCPSTSVAIEAIYNNLRKYQKVNVGILTVDKSSRWDLIRLAPKYGITIVADERFGHQDSDITAQFQKIKGTNAQAIVNWAITGPSMRLGIKAWKQQEMKIPLYMGPAFASRKNIDLAGEAAEGVLCALGRVAVVGKVGPDHPQKEVMMKYKINYEKRFNTNLSDEGGIVGGAVFDAIYFIVDAMKAVGKDKTKIRDYLEIAVKDRAGVSGIFNMSFEDHTGLDKDSFEICVVKNQEWVILE